MEGVKLAVAGGVGVGPGVGGVGGGESVGGGPGDEVDGGHDLVGGVGVEI